MSDDPVHTAALRGWELSTWAASVDWAGGHNTREWLLGLRERIEAVQVACTLGGLSSAAMTTEGHRVLDLAGLDPDAAECQNEDCIRTGECWCRP